MDLIISSLGMLSRGIPGLVLAGASMILMVLALIRKDAGLMFLAALFALPSTYIFGAWSGLLLVVRLMPLFLVGAAFAVNKEEMIFGWALSLPVLFYLIYFLINLVATGFSGV